MTWNCSNCSMRRFYVSFVNYNYLVEATKTLFSLALYLSVMFNKLSKICEPEHFQLKLYHYTFVSFDYNSLFQSFSVSFCDNSKG